MQNIDRMTCRINEICKNKNMKTIVIIIMIIIMWHKRTRFTTFKQLNETMRISHIQIQ